VSVASASFVTQLQLGGLTLLTGVSTVSAPPTATAETMHPSPPPSSRSQQVVVEVVAIRAPASLGALGALAVLALPIAGAVFWWRRRRASLATAAAQQWGGRAEERPEEDAAAQDGAPLPVVCRRAALLDAIQTPEPSPDGATYEPESLPPKFSPQRPRRFR
jgi:hypothetical protein